MGKMKSTAAGWFKLVAYPFVRPTRDLQRSAQALREAAQSARLQKQELEDNAKAVDELLSALTPQQKFQQAYEAWGWDERALAQQLVAVRRTRFTALATGGVGFAGVLLLMLFASNWFKLALAFVAIALVTGAVLQGIRFAWWEYAIETRSLIPLRKFLSRPDLMSRLLQIKGRQ